MTSSTCASKVSSGSSSQKFSVFKVQEEESDEIICEIKIASRKTKKVKNIFGPKAMADFLKDINAIIKKLMNDLYDENVEDENTERNSFEKQAGDLIQTSQVIEPNPKPDFGRNSSLSSVSQHKETGNMSKSLQFSPPPIVSTKPQDNSPGTPLDEDVTNSKETATEILEKISETLDLIRGFAAILKMPEISELDPVSSTNDFFKEKKISLSLELNQSSRELCFKLKNSIKHKGTLKEGEELELVRGILQRIIQEPEKTMNFSSSLDDPMSFDKPQTENTILCDSFLDGLAQEDSLLSTLSSEHISLSFPFQNGFKSACSAPKTSNTQASEFPSAFKGSNEFLTLFPKDGVLTREAYDVMIPVYSLEFEFSGVKSEAKRSLSDKLFNFHPTTQPMSLLNEYFQRCFNLSLKTHYTNNGRRLEIFCGKIKLIEVNDKNSTCTKEKLKAIGPLELVYRLCPEVYKAYIEFKFGKNITTV